MKIGIHSYVFYPENFLINELALKFKGLGHDVKVSTGLPNYESGSFKNGYSVAGPYSEDWNGVQIFRYPVIPRKKNIFFLLLNYLTNIFFSIINVVRMKNVDVSFVFGVSPIFSAIPAILTRKLYGAPVVVWLQDPWPESFAFVIGMSPKHPLYRGLGVFVRWVYRNVDLMLIQSPAFQSNLESYGYKGPVQLVPNWSPHITLDVHGPPAWIRQLPQNRFLLTFAGNIGIGQALDHLLDLAKALEGTRLECLIVGDGSDALRLKRRVQEEGIRNVHFLGRHPLKDMPFLFEKSTCLFVSLKSDLLSGLTIPSKVQSYMSAARPVLAVLHGAGADLIREAGCGKVVPPGDFLCLRQAAEDLLKMDEKELEMMGQRGGLYSARHFDRETILLQIERLVVTLVKAQ